MKTAIILILLAAAFIIYVGKPVITFNPFSFSLIWWKESVAVMFFILALGFHASHHRERGEEIGIKKGVVQGKAVAYTEVLSMINDAINKETATTDKQ
jgi:hypothetical protein